MDYISTSGESIPVLWIFLLSLFFSSLNSERMQPQRSCMIVCDAGRLCLHTKLSYCSLHKNKEIYVLKGIRQVALKVSR